MILISERLKAPFRWSKYTTTLDSALGPSAENARLNYIPNDVITVIEN